MYFKVYFNFYYLAIKQQTIPFCYKRKLRWAHCDEIASPSSKSAVDGSNNTPINGSINTASLLK